MRLNWRQIVIHFIASWFFIQAFEILSYLYDIKLVDIIRNTDEKSLSDVLDKEEIDHWYFADYLSIYPFLSGLLGLSIAFLISLIISIKRHWFWFNPLLVLLLSVVIFMSNLLNWSSVRSMFRYPGQIFNNTTIEYLLGGVISLTIGIVIFSTKRINRFIDGKKIMV